MIMLWFVKHQKLLLFTICSPDLKLSFLWKIFLSPQFLLFRVQQHLALRPLFSWVLLHRWLSLTCPK